MLKKSIKDIAVLAECFNIDIKSLSKEWLSIFTKRMQTRGRKDAIRFCKDLNTAAERYALHQSIEPIPWTKSDDDDFPLIISRFKRNLRSKNSMIVMFTLSVFRTIELARLPISKDISSVTDPSGADDSVVQDIINFIPSWTKRISTLSLGGLKYHLSVKNGPNGHALAESGADQLAIMNEPKLLEAIQAVQTQLNDQDPMDLNDDINYYDGKTLIHSKLTQFPEKAGKTRTIAIVDYYSQRCLRPLHKGLMRLLKSLVSDGTYSHSNVGKYAEQQTKDKTFIGCADLTSATDRFPATIQKVLLFELLKNDELAAGLWTLLAERSFTVAWSGEIVTYSCGQPMGCYASWPLFALAHHLVIAYSAYKAGVSDAKSKYRLIGDDVIINDENLWTSYKQIMIALGLTINAGKTVISPKASEFSAAEVAKQLYLNGTCITPLTPGFIRLIKKPHMFNTCLETLSSRYGESFGSALPPMLIQSLFRKEKTRRLVWLLASNPVNGYIKPTDVGYNGYSPWCEVDTSDYLNKNLGILANMIVEAATKEVLKQMKYNFGEVSPWDNWTHSQPKALKRAYKSAMWALSSSMKDIKVAYLNGNLFEVLAGIPFVPNPSTPYLAKNELRQKRVSSLILKLYQASELSKVP